ncbi:N-acetylmuramoyl-L-alanine amidase [Bacteroidia bacterium]|nr:N-acetylmuramoyl-L-alanine amidase [Bacteroidia bacterium]
MHIKFTLICILGFLTSSFIVSRDRSVNLETPQVEIDTNYEEQEDFLFYTKKVLIIVADNQYHIDLGQKYTSIKLYSSAHPEAIITVKSKIETLSFGGLNTDKNIDMPPSFVVFQSPTGNFILQSNTDTEITLELFYASPISASIPSMKYKKFDCEKPQTISQKIWREGLPDPIPGRISTVVNHCVIHHSAGSNIDTNYVNTLRNIYLYHTQSNGWDDIGYNFVIAPDGTIFSGRDSDGIADEDNVQGAHFCSKNGGTMGICLLGNFNDTTPSVALQKSLTNLLAWKLKKEAISPWDSYPHPNSLSDDLATITMHRAGCPTACPGDSVALLLDSIRFRVQKTIDECDGVVSIVKRNKKYKQLVYPNPSTGRFYVMIEDDAQVSSFVLKINDGRVSQEGIFPENGLFNLQVQAGLYYIELFNNEGLLSQTKIIIE